MWTPTTREQHSRKALRYQTDLTAAEWVVIEPHLPPAWHGTAPVMADARDVNGIFYVLRAGCPALAAKRFTTVGHDLSLVAKFRDERRLVIRERVGREASPSGAIIDSQIKTTAVAPAATMPRRSRGATPRAGRHRRARPRARGASGEYPGPRWWRAAAVRLTRLVSVHREGLCRQRLRRREGRHGDRRRDAQKPRSGRLRRRPAV